MTKTKSKRNYKNNRTRKLIKGLIGINDASIDPKCVSLKPFQAKFEKKFSKSLVKSNQTYKKKIAKQLLQKFAPTRLTPNNDFYKRNVHQQKYLFIIYILYKITNKEHGLLPANRIKLTQTLSLS